MSHLGQHYCEQRHRHLRERQYQRLRRENPEQKHERQRGDLDREKSLRRKRLLSLAVHGTQAASQTDGKTFRRGRARGDRWISFAVPAAHAQTELSVLCVTPDITVELTSGTITPQQVICYNSSASTSVVNLAGIPVGTRVSAYFPLSSSQ